MVIILCVMWTCFILPLRVGFGDDEIGERPTSSCWSRRIDCSSPSFNSEFIIPIHHHMPPPARCALGGSDVAPMHAGPVTMIDLIIDLFFSIDIVVNFCTGYFVVDGAGLTHRQSLTGVPTPLLLLGCALKFVQQGPKMPGCGIGLLLIAGRDQTVTRCHHRRPVQILFELPLNSPQSPGNGTSQ